MDNKQFVVEILKYAAWPAVVTAAIFILKDKITNVFSGGIKSLKHGETEVQFLESQQSIKPEGTEIQNLQHLIPVDPTGLREELEAKIITQLTQISEDTQKIDVLVKNLAQQQISNAFEKIYYNIFGSQIRLLEFLSVQEEGKSNTKNIINFYENAIKQNPELFEGMQFSDYMNFLVSWELVRNLESEWLITNNGRAFITYITAMQLTKNKAF